MVNLILSQENGEYEVKKEFKEVITIKHLPKGTFLLKEGNFLSKNYLVVKGICHCFINKDGKEITTYFATDNCPIAALDLYDGDKKGSSLNIELLDDSILLEMDSLKTREIIYSNPKYTRAYCNYLDKEYIKLATNQMANRFTTAKERYDKFFKDYPQIIKKVKLTIIASYLDISLETLSRIRAEYVKKGKKLPKLKK